MNDRRITGDPRRNEAGKAGLNNPKNEVAVSARNIEHAVNVCKDRAGDLPTGALWCATRSRRYSRPFRRPASIKRTAASKSSELVARRRVTWLSPGIISFCRRRCLRDRSCSACTARGRRKCSVKAFWRNVIRSWPSFGRRRRDGCWPPRSSGAPSWLRSDLRHSGHRAMRAKRHGIDGRPPLLVLSARRARARATTRKTSSFFRRPPSRGGRFSSRRPSCQARGCPGSRQGRTTQTYGGDLEGCLRILRRWADISFSNARDRAPMCSIGCQNLATGPEGNSYASVICLACTRLHFIHKETGKLLGED